MNDTTVALHFQKTGEGRPLIILHGIFGLGDNWKTQANLFAEDGFSVYNLDQRDHGRSPHTGSLTYPLMAEDVYRFMRDHRLENASLIGHSMGGKTGMFFARQHPELLSRLVVVDIAPRRYPPHHQAVLSALHAVDLNRIRSRKEAEVVLRSGLKDEGTIQFLLKNLYWKDDDTLAWRFNLPVIEKDMENMGAALPEDTHIALPSLFVRGANSGYITREDEALIRSMFTNVKLVTVPNAGHWVHAENPVDFHKVVRNFLMD